jgi:electron transport complex protein RnfD
MAAPSDVNEINISSSPHFADNWSTAKIMLAVIIALMPLCVYGIVLYGLSALITILVSVASCVVFEFLFQKLAKQPVRVGDLSCIVTGLLLALVMPPAVPFWMVILGAFFAIVVAKGFFGGIGANVFNPALTGRAFMFVSFPIAMTTWSTPFADAVSGATPLVSGGTDYMSLFLGQRAGCIGESSVLLIVLACLFLIVMRVIDWRLPISMVGTVALCTLIAGGDVLAAVMTGGLLFGSVFMITDYATSPVTPWGRVLFGAGCGLITFLIRNFGGFPEGVMFSILIMNVMVPFLNRIVPRKYGYGKKKAAKEGK